MEPERPEGRIVMDERPREEEKKLRRLKRVIRERFVIPGGTT